MQLSSVDSVDDFHHLSAKVFIQLDAKFYALQNGVFILQFDWRKFPKSRPSVNNSSILRGADIHISIWQFFDIFRFSRTENS